MAVRKHIANRILAMICVAALVIMQGLFVLPEVSHAASGGLVVRVQYAGERGDKIRTKCTFTTSELEKIGSGTYYYNNLNRVGTIRRSKASGPEITSIIKAAGIDLNSVESFALIVNYSDERFGQQLYGAGKYLYTERYYYPNLTMCKKGSASGDFVPVIFQQGALDNAKPVPTILATKYYSTISSSVDLSNKAMTASKGYRMFIGQTSLKHLEYEVDVTEPGEPTEPTEPAEPTEPSESVEPAEPATPDGGGEMVDNENNEGTSSSEDTVALGSTLSIEKRTQTRAKEVRYKSSSEEDVTSWDSIYNITGIDIILSGSPGINGISLGTDGTNVKIGGTKQITAKVDGDFQGFSNSDLTWTTSDSSKATVDRNGKVTIHGKGAVTITATAENGISASITLNGTAEDKAEAAGKAGGKKGKGKNEEKKAATMKVREIVIGDEIKPQETLEESGGQDASADAETLEAAEEFSPKTVAASAAVAAAACCGGIVFRVRRYYLDMGKVITKEK